MMVYAAYSGLLDCNPFSRRLYSYGYLLVGGNYEIQCVRTEIQCVPVHQVNNRYFRLLTYGLLTSHTMTVRRFRKSLLNLL